MHGWRGGHPRDALAAPGDHLVTEESLTGRYRVVRLIGDGALARWL
jgi:hypothetical protein